MRAEVYLRGGRVVLLNNITNEDRNNLESGLDSQTTFHRVFVKNWVFDGKAIDAVWFIGEVTDGN